MHPTPERRPRHQQIVRRGTALAGKGSERVLAAAAHGAIAFGFVGVGFLASLAITAVIWLGSKKSPYVREQSDRAGRYQLFVVLANILLIGLWLAGLVLLLYLTGWRNWGNENWQAWQQINWRWVIVSLDGILLLLSAPFIIAWYFGSIIYGVIIALRALQGHDAHYPPPPWQWRRRAGRQQLDWD